MQAWQFNSIGIYFSVHTKALFHLVPIKERLEIQACRIEYRFKNTQILS